MVDLCFLVLGRRDASPTGREGYNSSIIHYSLFIIHWHQWGGAPLLKATVGIDCIVGEACFASLTDLRYSVSPRCRAAVRGVTPSAKRGGAEKRRRLGGASRLLADRDWASVWVEIRLRFAQLQASLGELISPDRR